MYVARNPYKTDLHALVRENYRQVFFDKEVEGSNLPFHLEREFKKYLYPGRKTKCLNKAGKYDERET